MLKDVPGPSQFLIRNLILRNFTSAWKVLINKNILRSIKLYTEIEADRRLQNRHWNTSLDLLDAFIILPYACGFFISKGISIKNLRLKNWGINFFAKECLVRY